MNVGTASSRDRGLASEDGRQPADARHDGACSVAAGAAAARPELRAAAGVYRGGASLGPADRRCLGQLPSFDGEQPCRKRDSCQRYTQRDTGKAAWTLTAQWMCPGKDDYWQFLIPVVAV